MRTVNYKPRKCTKCNAFYIPRSSTQEWCDTCLTKLCEECGKPFHIGKKSKYEASRFCSVECKRTWMKREMVGQKAPNFRSGTRSVKVIVRCSVCGNEIEREKGQADKWDVYFCSNKCRSKYQAQNRKGKNNSRYNRVKTVCEWCNKKFETWPSIKDEVKFCSKKCRNDWQSHMMSGERHPNWKGGVSEKRSKDWVSREYKEWRKKVFERDNYTCQICGDNTGGNLNAHHIKSYRDYPELRYEVSNGMTLCKFCHVEVHSKK